MAGEWTETTIGELLATKGGSVKTGPFGTALKAKEYSTEGVPLISVGEVGYGTLRVHAKTPRAPTEVVKRLPEYVLEAGDIVFGRKGAVDRSALVKPDQAGWFLGSDGIRLRLPNTCDARFVAYHLQSSEARSWLIQHATGTTMASLNQAIIERMPLFLPSIGEQRAIAHILGTLDDKIELNRRMNETLEAMARALFKSWFVDFDPVRAKAAGGCVGLPDDMSDLFSGEFVESDRGEIPKGWRIASLLDQATLLSGGTPKTERSQYWDGNIKWASAKDVSQCKEAFLIETERTITENGLNNSATQLIPRFASVVVARGATTGRMVLFGREMAMNQTCYALWSDIGAPFALYCQLSEEVRELVHAAHGSVFDTITTSTFKNARSVLAPEPVIARFEQIVSPWFGRILANCEQSKTLAALRDTLLPKLISGELRVKAAEKIVEAVA
ncbi:MULTISPECIES: restriction endonuclease subunit S [unclassified Bradyrhizobium]|uniref:restriction endonuclease subunit S n=1 Tax=unclassified Bradyrhizobium TaxID=2631580 RepID=UPI0029163981|nr:MULTISPECIES: restriction endonuclease subunit S [unclassified Bradyrhizobium]